MDVPAAMCGENPKQGEQQRQCLACLSLKEGRVAPAEQERGRVAGESEAARVTWYRTFVSPDKDFLWIEKVTGESYAEEGHDRSLTSCFDKFHLAVYGSSLCPTLFPTLGTVRFKCLLLCYQETGLFYHAFNLHFPFTCVYWLSEIFQWSSCSSFSPIFLLGCFLLLIWGNSLYILDMNLL